MIKGSKGQYPSNTTRKRQLSSIQENILEGLTENIDFQISNTLLKQKNKLSNSQYLLKFSRPDQSKPPIVNSMVNQMIVIRQNKVYDTMIVSDNQVTDKYFSYLEIQSLSKESYMVDLMLVKIKERQNTIISEIIEGIIGIQNEQNKIQRSLPDLNSKQPSIFQNPQRYNNSITNDSKLVNQRKRFNNKQLHKIFKTQSSETKIIARYIKQKSLQRKQLHQRVQKAKSMKLKKLQQFQRQEQIKKQQELKQRNQSLIKLFQQKMMVRSLNKQQRAKRQLEYRKLLKNDKPLFEKLQEQDSIKRKQQQEQFTKQLQLKKCIKLINPQDINKFQQQYILLRQTKDKERQQKFRIKLQQSVIHKKYYRSKFHQFIQKNYTDPDQHKIQMQKMKQLRRIQYSKQVKDKIKIEVDDKLKQQLKMSIIRQKRQYRYQTNTRSRQQSRSANSQIEQEKKTNSKIDGLKFLKFAKQRRNKTLSIKQSNQQQPKTEGTLSHSQSKISHLSDHQLLNKFISNIKQSKDSKEAKKNLLKAKAIQLDQKANRSEQLLRLQHVNLKNCPDPEQYFIDAIRTKIQYLKL